MSAMSQDCDSDSLFHISCFFCIFLFQTLHPSPPKYNAITTNLSHLLNKPQTKYNTHHQRDIKRKHVLSTQKNRDRCDEVVSRVFRYRIPFRCPTKPTNAQLSIPLFSDSDIPTFVNNNIRLMSDYEVTLVNDNMQEFYVRFHGPADSTLCFSFSLSLRHFIWSLVQYITITLVPVPLT